MSTVKRALRQFTFGQGKSAGRNASGRITSFHRGGGAKRLQRTIDLKRNDAKSVGIVERIEYDPNRSSRIALIRWIHGVPNPRLRTTTDKSSAADTQPSKVLDVDPSAGNAVRGVFAFNSMLPHTGTASRDVFFNAFGSKGKKGGAECKPESELLSLGLPRIAVAAARAEFFAPRVKGEERLQVRNWKRNSDVWAHRNKRKAAISWHSIAR